MKIRGIFKNIRDLYISYDTIEKMPLILRFVTKVSLSGFIVFPIFFLVDLFLIPVMGGITVNGEYHTWQEYWKRGEPLYVLAAASLILPIPYGLLGKKKWIRPFLIGSPFIQIIFFEIVGLVFNNSQWQSIFKTLVSIKDILWYALNVSAWILLSTWYLY